MPDKVVPPAEAFPTLVAPAGPHRGMPSQVLGKRSAVVEAAPTLAAQVQLLGCMRLPVRQIAPVVTEVLATLSTQVGLAPKVDSLVCC